MACGLVEGIKLPMDMCSTGTNVVGDIPWKYIRANGTTNTRVASRHQLVIKDSLRCRHRPCFSYDRGVNWMESLGISKQAG